MSLSSTPRARFPRKRFISPAASSPYRSPLIHRLPEKIAQSSFENELKSPKIALDDKNDIPKETNHPKRQKFVSPIATTSQYRSPFAPSISDKKTQSSSENTSLDQLKSSTLELWEKNKALKEKIQHLEQQGLKEDDLKWYIDKLHRYNEIKDVAQMVFGRLAIIEQKTIKEVHEDFGMTEND